MGARSRLGSLAVSPVLLVLCGCVPSPMLLMDVQTATNSSDPAELTAVADGIAFSATFDGLGRELGYYGSNGVLTKVDVAPDVAEGFPSNLFANGDHLYFGADEDGDMEGYSMFSADPVNGLVKLLPETGVSAQDAFTAVAAFGAEGTLFTHLAEDSGTELWRTDGTAAGTAMVQDIAPGPPSSAPDAFAALGGFYCFAAANGAGDRELWRTDGATATLVRNINASGSSSPSNLVAYGGKIYFAARGSSTPRRGLFTTDGTSAGTVLVTDDGSDTFAPVPVGVAAGKLFLLAHGDELWASDGTVAGTAKLVTLPGAGGVAGSFVTLGSRILFQTGSHELWASDGTTVGTQMIHGASSEGERGVALGAFVYFASGDQVLRTDGTAAGTQALGTVRGAGSLVVALGKVFLRGADASGDSELWSIEPSTGAPSLAANANDATGDSYAQEFVDSGGLTFFTANGPQGGELYRTDLTPGGTALVADIRPAGHSAPQHLTSYGGVLYFAADDGVNGRELWRSDGTAAGTYLFKDLLPTGSSQPRELEVAGGYLWFNAHGANGRELWRSDGTAAGTLQVVDINPGAADSSPRWHTVLGARTCFFATTAALGREPFCTDGTAAGTVNLKDINPGAASSMDEHQHPVVMGGFMYFAANDGSTGYELWRSDGTPAGTTRVADVFPGSASSLPESCLVSNGWVYFATWGDPYDLFRTNGTSTEQLTGWTTGDFGEQVPVNPQYVSGVFRIAALNGTIYFGGGGAGGAGLYRTDGTAAGVTLVESFANLQDLRPVGDVLFFTAFPLPVGTKELYRTDDLGNGTVRLTGDIGDGFSVGLGGMWPCQGKLCVGLTTRELGDEPYVVGL